MPDLADWTRSTACTVGSCVEARFCDGHIELRDTRQPGPILAIEVDDWAAFIAGAKNGEFDVAEDPTDPILRSLRARFPDAINEREQPVCGHWSRHGLGPCLCGNPNGHGDTR